VSRMLDATVALIVGTFITITYWFAIAGPLNSIVAAIDSAKGTTFSGRGLIGVPSYNEFLNTTTSILGVWLIATLISYLIMFWWEGQRTEDLYGRGGTVY
jgi:hypothetical protein